MPSPKKKHQSRARKHSKRSRKQKRNRDNSDFEEYMRCSFVIQGALTYTARLDETSTPASILEGYTHKSPDHVISVYLGRLGFERTLESGEQFWPIYVHCKEVDYSEENKYSIKIEPMRFEHLTNARIFFPSFMFAIDDRDFKNLHNTPIARHTDLQYMLRFSDKVPWVFGELSIKVGNDDWGKHFVLLKNGVLYSSESRTMNTSEMEELLNVADFDVYTVKEPTSRYKSKYGHCFALKKPLVESYEDDVEDEDKDIDEAEASSNYIMFSSMFMEVCLCWMTAIRITKYGKDIRDLFRDYTLRSYELEHMPDESVRTKIAIAYSDKVSIYRKRNPALEASPLSERLSAQTPETTAPRCLLDMPFYVAQMKKHEADGLLRRYKHLPGVYLIRDSNETDYDHVLSYTSGERIGRAPTIECSRIKLVDGNGVTKQHSKGIPRYLTIHLDNRIPGDGHPAFFDLLQLVEYYQLNDDLGIKLTRFVDKNGKLYTPDGKLAPECEL